MNGTDVKSSLLVVNLSTAPDTVWVQCAGEAGWTLHSGEDAHALQSIPQHAKAIILYTSALNSVLELVNEHGLAPLDAIASWKEKTEDLLRFYRRRRRHTFLLDIDVIRLGTNDQIEAAARWTGLDLMPVQTQSQGSAQSDALVTALVQYALGVDAEVKKLSEELYVGGSGFEQAPLISAEDLALAFGQLKSEQQDLATVKSEVEHLRVALDENVTRLDMVQRAHDTQARTASEAIAEERRKIKQISSEFSELKMEEVNLRKAYTKLLEVHEHARLRLEESGKKNKELEQKLKGAKQGAFSVERDSRDYAEAVEREKDALVEQLQVAQRVLKDQHEEIKDIRLAMQRDFEIRLANVRTEKDSIIAKLEALVLSSQIEGQKQLVQRRDLEQRIVSLSEESRLLQLTLQERDFDVQELLASTSWRITAPMRRLRMNLS